MIIEVRKQYYIQQCHRADVEDTRQWIRIFPESEWTFIDYRDALKKHKSISKADPEYEFRIVRRTIIDEVS